MLPVPSRGALPLLVRPKLVLTNPSKLPHYFSALQFAGAVWSRKVETADACR
jgi:hypothetical protein